MALVSLPHEFSQVLEIKLKACTMNRENQLLVTNELVELEFASN